MQDGDMGALKDKSVFLADVEKILGDISLLLEENRKVRADFEALSRVSVTGEQMLRHTSLLSEVDSCLKRIAAEQKQLRKDLAELRKPDRRLVMLEEEVRLLNRDLEKLRSELDRPPDPRLVARISRLELGLDSQKVDIEMARSRAEDVSKQLLHHKLRAGRRRIQYRCD